MCRLFPLWNHAIPAGAVPQLALVSEAKCSPSFEARSYSTALLQSSSSWSRVLPLWDAEAGSPLHPESQAPAHQFIPLATTKLGVVVMDSHLSTHFSYFVHDIPFIQPKRISVGRVRGILNKFSQWSQHPKTVESSELMHLILARWRLCCFCNRCIPHNWQPEGLIIIRWFDLKSGSYECYTIVHQFFSFLFMPPKYCSWHQRCTGHSCHCSQHWSFCHFSCTPRSLQFRSPSPCILHQWQTGMDSPRTFPGTLRSQLSPLDHILWQKSVK